MTDILESRTNIQSEEAQFRASVSEALAFRLGQSINFINKRQHKSFDFKFFGAFRPLNGGEDGVQGLIENVEIVGITGYLRITGASGTTTVDVHQIRAGVDLGSILSTKLQITSAAANGINFGNHIPDADESEPTGITLPVFSTVNLNRFDTLRVDLDGNANGARDLIMQIHYRPRN